MATVCGAAAFAIQSPRPYQAHHPLFSALSNRPLATPTAAAREGNALPIDTSEMSKKKYHAKQHSNKRRLLKRRRMAEERRAAAERGLAAQEGEGGGNAVAVQATLLVEETNVDSPVIRSAGAYVAGGTEARREGGPGLA
ncbi:hypothetical protein ONZ51_g9505 [Trametes cubensis]|uniref:Uncharacterized protein n=1 Tax=Trametes cubensis TaxID=1111947 RepID=A0AAD7X7M0_9APHY|nr:hypothetical protein ONZ51_g9505 [Trametes cubensis]